jgi:hypothetical protein
MNVAKGGNPGPTAYYVKYRPVFAAAAPGQLVSPELAGRFAADFGLGAQLTARHRLPAARQFLSLARGVYAMAQTTHVTSIVTTFPNDYYGGTEWKSDMLWGAAEIALADEALGAPASQVRADLLAASKWARAYIAQGHHPGGDTLNLYDNGAVGESELLRAIQRARSDTHTASSEWNGVVGAHPLLTDLAAQLRLGERSAKGDPFQLGGQLGNTDASPHAFGLYITNALYREYGGGSQFTASLTGRGDIQLGAVTDGPNSPSSFVGLGTVAGMRTCGVGGFAPFNTKSAAYEDNVVSWPSVEPADDYVANSLLAFAFAAS